MAGLKSRPFKTKTALEALGGCLAGLKSRPFKTKTGLEALGGYLAGVSLAPARVPMAPRVVWAELRPRRKSSSV
jgi:hypothetical protein